MAQHLFGLHAHVGARAVFGDLPRQIDGAVVDGDFRQAGAHMVAGDGAGGGNAHKGEKNWLPKALG